MSNVSITGYAGWPVYDAFLIMSLSGWPVYNPNPLRSNPNLKKPVSSLCRVHGLDRILTPLIKYNTRVKSFVFYLFHAIREIISSFSFFVKSSHLFRKEKSHGTFSVDPFSLFHGFIFFYFYIVTTFQLMGLIFFTKIIIIIIVRSPIVTQTQNE